MPNIQADHSSEVSISLSPNQVALSQAAPPSAIDSATNTLAPTAPAFVIDYLPDDRHHVLSPLWRGIQPFQQLMIGSVLGMALGLSLMAWVINAKKAIHFTSLTANNTQTIGLIRLTLDLLYHRFGEPSRTSASPNLTMPIANVQPLLKPIMMDRFYLPINEPGLGQEEAPPSAIIVDRFYFDRREIDATNDVMNPRVLAEQLSLPVPLLPPPPDLQTLSAATTSVQAISHQALPQSGAISPVSRPVQANRLIGVIQTGRFSAALVQTEQNSYAVRLGERISQSTWKLIEVQDNSVVLSDGKEQLLLRVGDVF